MVWGMGDNVTALHCCTASCQPPLIRPHCMFPLLYPVLKPSGKLETPTLQTLLCTSIFTHYQGIYYKRTFSHDNLCMHSLQSFLLSSAWLLLVHHSVPALIGCSLELEFDWSVKL